MAERRKKPGKTDVVGFLFSVMQGKAIEKEQLKAAELLGKYFGMFEKRERKADKKPVEFVGDETLED